MQVAHPAKGEQQQRHHVMDKHLPEVLALHIHKLADGERPVEAHGQHVVPPDVRVQRLMRETVPAVLDVPQPGLVPQHVHAEREAEGVVDAAPRRLAELDQR